MTDKEKIKKLSDALLFYARMQFHPREAKIRAVIDNDNGERADEALKAIGESSKFFDDDIKFN